MAVHHLRITNPARCLCQAQGHIFFRDFYLHSNMVHSNHPSLHHNRIEKPQGHSLRNFQAKYDDDCFDKISDYILVSPDDDQGRFMESH